MKRHTLLLACLVPLAALPLTSDAGTIAGTIDDACGHGAAVLMADPDAACEVGWRGGQLLDHMYRSVCWRVRTPERYDVDQVDIEDGLGETLCVASAFDVDWKLGWPGRAR